MTLQKLKSFDLYRKTPVDLTTPTATGSVISIVAAVVMSYLFLSEVISFLSYETVSEMVVQSESEVEKLPVHLNITFPKLPCFVFSIDVVDIMGRHEMGVSDNIVKWRISSTGDLMGKFETHDQSEFGAMRSEGCIVDGFVLVNKVPGNFHLSAHGQAQLVMSHMNGELNLAHVINNLYAGADVPPKDFPGHHHPLNGLSQLHNPSTATYEYYLDFVPTEYTTAWGRKTSGYQTTARRHAFALQPMGHMPAVFFRYQISPIQVKYITRRKSFAHFIASVIDVHAVVPQSFSGPSSNPRIVSMLLVLTQQTYLCAIVGGVFTVAGIVNSMIQSSIVAIQKNVLGKSS